MQTHSETERSVTAWGRQRGRGPAGRRAYQGQGEARDDRNILIQDTISCVYAFVRTSHSTFQIHAVHCMSLMLP